jgi:outer membrane murein-binding lipoprotein Lpp
VKALFFFLVAGLLIILFIAGCGVSKSDYDNLVADYNELNVSLEQANQTITRLTEENNALRSRDGVRYFKNRNEVEDWLQSVPKLGVSEDVEEWYQFALFYQHRAIYDGYIISVCNWEEESGITIWCEIITEDGWVYFFDPDDCELIDQYMRIDTSKIDELESKVTADFL